MTELDKYLHFTLAFSFSFQWVNLHDCGVYRGLKGIAALLLISAHPLLEELFNFDTYVHNILR